MRVFLDFYVPEDSLQIKCLPTRIPLCSKQRIFAPIDFRFQLPINHRSAKQIEPLQTKGTFSKQGIRVHPVFHLGQYKVMIETIHSLEFENRSKFKRARLVATSTTRAVRVLIFSKQHGTLNGFSAASCKLFEMDKKHSKRKPSTGLSPNDAS